MAPNCCQQRAKIRPPLLSPATLLQPPQVADAKGGQMRFCSRLLAPLKPLEGGWHTSPQSPPTQPFRSRAVSLNGFGRRMQEAAVSTSSPYALPDQPNSNNINTNSSSLLHKTTKIHLIFLFTTDKELPPRHTYYSNQHHQLHLHQMQDY